MRDPVDGFEKLRAFEKEYAALDDGISGYLKRWLWDYVIYYRLDPVLLADRPELAFDIDRATYAYHDSRKFKRAEVLLFYEPTNKRAALFVVVRRFMKPFARTDARDSVKRRVRSV